MAFKPALRLVASNVQRFLALQSASGIVLACAALLAMVVANSSLGPLYRESLHVQLGPLTLEAWINDVLMAIFFFVVGMEIKFELSDGALASRDRAIFPVVAALGGMVAPALIYAAFNHGTDAASGWGIPMATDIAFAVGVLTLLGKRVPVALKVFLLALAIADDLGAVIVIAVFYSTGVKLLSLLAAGVLCATIWWLAKKNVRQIPLHVALGAGLWFLVHDSGIHATIAGCALGFLMPHDDDNPDDETPLERWVARLHPVVGFAIMPIFAFANAGLSFEGLDWRAAFASPLVSGIGYGLFIGKPLGIFGFSWMAEKLGLARRPEGVGSLQLFGVACLGGIGFTMALFVSQLALRTEAVLELAKIGIIAGSLSSALVGLSILLMASRRRA
ncbi:MAG: Na+/H+ antiporter NhaA [Bdellovibrionota bacterium]